MTEQKTRRQAVRQWTCPNHPDGQPVLPADGWERKELTIQEAYGPEFVESLRRLYESGSDDAIHVGMELGVCCIGHKWKVIGYEDVPVSPFADFLYEAAFAQHRNLFNRNILLSELHRDRGT